MDDPLLAHLTTAVKLKASVAKQYAAGLADEGFDTPALFDALSLEELATDFGFKKGHLTAVKTYREGLAPPPSPQSPQVGEPIGSKLEDGSDVHVYTDQKLGQGGQGVVCKAIVTRRSGTTEEVAAKMLGMGATEREHQKFAKEFEIQRRASQQCEGVCRVYGTVRYDGALCIVMRRYQQSLWDLLDSRVDPADATKRVPLPLPQALTIALSVARALVGLHGVDIRMQDLKPSNLLLDDQGVPVVSDFGIAKIEGATFNSILSKAGGGGTSNFMAPELFEEENITNKVDIWSWAVVLVQMLSGQMPWAGKSQIFIGRAVVDRKQTPTIPPKAPKELASILTSCFAFDPAQRPTATQLVEALHPLVAAATTPETMLSMNCSAILQGSWAKREVYSLSSMTSAVTVANPAHELRYEAYKAKVAAENGGDADEQLLFHGCSEEALQNIQRDGFSKKYWRTAAGEWQRYGPGFYFAIQSSKSHEYPIEEMNALPQGPGSRSMLLSKVVRGRVHRTEVNMDTLQGAPPPGCHSVYGVATPNGPLNYDELVVYEEAAILPYAVVTYDFVKHVGPGAVVEEGPEPEPEEEYFEVLKTGDTMTKLQLFDAGINKTECRSLGEAATAARQTLTGSLAGAKVKAEVLARGIAAVDKVVDDLTSNRAAVEAAIDTETAGIKQTVCQCIDKRTAELKAALAQDHDGRRAALDRQRAQLVQQHQGQTRLCTEGAAAIERDDMSVVKLLASVQGDLQTAAAAMPEVVPERDPAITYLFDAAVVSQTAVPALAAFGALNPPPPDLQGYSEPAPKYSVGQAIAPNRPVGSLPIGQHGLRFSAAALPAGLLLDASTGVLTGTPTVKQEAVSLEVTACHGDTGGRRTVRLPVQVTGEVIHQLPFSGAAFGEGALHHIGTKGRTRPWANPAEAGEVACTASGMLNSSCKATALAARPSEQANALTDGSPGGWWQVDLGAKRRLAPSHYALANAHDGNCAHALRSWELQGSASPTGPWTTLKAHSGDASIATTKGAEASWALPASLGPFRAFRLQMTGTSASGNHLFASGGMELYGALQEQP